MSDVKCPYCESEIDTTHKWGPYEGQTYEHECEKCKKNFVYEVYEILRFDASKADCLNGAEHKYKDISFNALNYDNYLICEICKNAVNEYDPKYAELREKLTKKEVRDE